MREPEPAVRLEVPQVGIQPVQHVGRVSAVQRVGPQPAADPAHDDGGTETSPGDVADSVNRSYQLPPTLPLPAT